MLDFIPHGGGRFDIQPLDFVQFVNVVANKNPSFPVIITNAIASSTITVFENEKPLTLNAVMEGPVSAYGLIDGGWIPMPWAHKRIAWLDRNIVITLEKLQGQTSETESVGSRSRLLEQFGIDNDIVSPILFGLEGACQSPPTEFSLRVELSRAAKVLARALPAAKIQKAGTEQRKALHRMIVDHAQFHLNATRLLIRAVPFVVDKVKPEKRLRLEESVLQMARDEGVRSDSLPVLALLSCVYDANPAISTHRAATPGRAVIKPMQNYENKNAYNALADMFALELLHNAHAIFPTLKPVLYTQDVGMASLWTATQPCTRLVTSGPNGRVRTTVSFGLNRGLFPALSEDEVVALSTRLRE
jgi:hypothetical protein